MLDLKYVNHWKYILSRYQSMKTFHIFIQSDSFTYYLLNLAIGLLDVNQQKHAIFSRKVITYLLTYYLLNLV